MTYVKPENIPAEREFGPEHPYAYCSECGRRGQCRTWVTYFEIDEWWTEHFGLARTWHFQCRDCQRMEEAMAC